MRRPRLADTALLVSLLGIWAATTPTERTVLRRERREGVVASAEEPNAPAPQISEPALIDLVEESERDAERAPDPEPLPRQRRGPRRGWREPLVGDHAELLTPAEAARKLGVTPNTVTRWSRAGKIAAIQTMGGHRRFRRSEIERLLRDANATATSQY